MAEGRFQRWSRLKRKGGADDRDEARVEEARVEETRAEEARSRRGSAAPVVGELPGGRLKRTVVPPLPPLAADAPEDDDLAATTPAAEATPETDAKPENAIEVDALAGQAAAEDLFDGIEDRELTEEEQAAIADLPPLDGLTKDSDYTPFLQAGIPDIIKRKALRLLWRRDPFFNLRDGLNEYDDDYTIINTAISELTGNYKVGRGYLSDQELRDMTPERTRKAFGMDDEAEAVAAEESEADDGDDEAKRQPAAADVAGTGPDEAAADDDEVGDGEDEPLS